MQAHVRSDLGWIAGTLAHSQPTGILGEAWRVDDGRVRSYVSQPHVWEHALFYLTAIETYSRSRYRAGQPDRLLPG